MNVSSNSGIPFCLSISCSRSFHELNHPAIGVPPFMESFIYVLDCTK